LGRHFYYHTFKSNIAYSIAYIILLIVEFLLRPLPLRAKYSFGWLVGSLWYMVDTVDRDLCRRDMALALGRTHSLSTRKRALRRSMANIMACHIESYFTTGLSRNELLGMVTNPQWSRPLVEALDLLVAVVSLEELPFAEELLGVVGYYRRNGSHNLGLPTRSSVYTDVGGHPDSLQTTSTWSSLRWAASRAARIARTSGPR